MPTYSTPVADIIDRLNYHTKAGQTPNRILAGWKFESIPTSSTEGPKDLPSIRIYVPEVKGKYRPARNEDGTMTFKLLISTKRSDGLVAHLQGVEKVMDALNHNTSGLIKNIAGLAKPWEWETGENYIVDHSISSEINMALMLQAVELGNRRI